MFWCNIYDKLCHKINFSDNVLDQIRPKISKFLMIINVYIHIKWCFLCQFYFFYIVNPRLFGDLSDFKLSDTVES